MGRKWFPGTAERIINSRKKNMFISMHLEHCPEHIVWKIFGFSSKYEHWNINRLFEEIKKKMRKKEKKIPERSRLGYWSVC